ncbi:MAG: porin family protein [Rickettsiales bacterium]|jgi:outer membrane protein W|nr:porin family protein [Rickettsiales bacterium]
MKKIVLTSLAAVLLATSANAGAYISGYATTRSDDGVDIFDAMSLDASIGYAFSNGLRIEADVFTANIYDGNDATDLNIVGTVSLGVLKGLYDFKNDSKFTPYLGLGIDSLGLGYVFRDKADSSNANLPFIGQFVVGATYAINEKISIDLQYNRNFSWAWTRSAIGNNSTSSTNSSGSNAYKLGIRYNF